MQSLLQFSTIAFTLYLTSSRQSSIRDFYDWYKSHNIETISLRHELLLEILSHMLDKFVIYFKF